MVITTMTVENCPGFDATTMILTTGGTLKAMTAAIARLDGSTMKHCALSPKREEAFRRDQRHGDIEGDHQDHVDRAAARIAADDRWASQENVERRVGRQAGGGHRLLPPEVVAENEEDARDDDGYGQQELPAP
ncbi:hypothetical protein [Nonomuraea guangzhouensis]|uniref:Uncharacterized protein n=1 Tax=Nonomuraea guangzhouensis TaxID=1291555 RepID=A0ABW4GTH8_9ACTN|nr:hypothetical protein [Nonomuraea guangzhouensis]